LTDEYLLIFLIFWML